MSSSKSSYVSHSNDKTKQISQRQRHHYREELIKRKIINDRIPIILLNLHGGVFLNGMQTGYVCNQYESPFKLMYRIINASTAETTALQGYRYFTDPVFDRLTLTPESLAKHLNKNPDYCDGTNDKQSKVCRARLKNDQGEIQDHVFTNFGSKDRYFKSINYQDSPYCHKYLMYDESLNVDGDRCGIIVLNKILEGNGIPKHHNFLFDEKLMTWLEMEKGDDVVSWQIEEANGKKFISRIDNDLLYEYLSKILQIKKVFIIDNSCEYIKEINTYFDKSVAEAVLDLKTSSSQNKLFDSYDALLVELRAMEEEIKERERVVKELDKEYDLDERTKATLEQYIGKEFNLKLEKDVRKTLRTFMTEDEIDDIIDDSLDYLKSKNLANIENEIRQLRLHYQRKEQRLHSYEEKMIEVMKRASPVIETVQVEDTKKRNTKKRNYSTRKLETNKIDLMIDYKARMKQNKGHWHVIKPNDSKIR
jgi:hypothetical protein